MKKLFALVLALCFVLCCAAMAEENDAAYLAQLIGENPFGEVATVEAFNTVLTAFGQEEIASATLEDAAVACIKLADMTELAMSYLNEENPDKAKEILDNYGMKVADPDNAPFVACAFDLGFIDYEEDPTAEVSGERAVEMVNRAIEMAGLGRHYIGMISDWDIQQKVRSVLNSFVMFDNEELTNLGTEIVLRGATTGYNLKYDGYNANFLEDLTIKYGHSDTKHAVQLVSLLQSEGFEGYIQIEPKVSVYEYMIDWGEPGEPTPTYAVRQVTEDRYLCYAIEYDMQIEFLDKDMKEAFHEVIETYAKKYDDSFDADGNLVKKVIAGAWWQPLYTSTTEMENEEFGLLYDNVIYDASGMFSIHPFSVPENCETIAAAVAEIAPELVVSPVAIHTNPAFMRYITGSDYQ